MATDSYRWKTGTGPAFDAAHALYLKNGFTWCDALGDYESTDFNVFMVKNLDGKRHLG